MEYEPIMQMELKACLEQAGAAVVGPVATLDAAKTFAEAEVLDAAILDVKLIGRSVAPAARILHARGIPALFTTGYHDLETLPPTLRHFPRNSDAILA